MKVILKKDVSNLGDEGDIVSVSEGHARNYLIPKNLGIEASKSALKELEKKNAAREKKILSKKEEIKKNLADLEGKVFEIKADAGEGGRLFGSVTKDDIAKAVRVESKMEIDKKKIELLEPIRLVGDYKVTIKFATELTAFVNIKVIPS